MDEKRDFSEVANKVIDSLPKLTNKGKKARQEIKLENMKNNSNTLRLKQLMKKLFIGFILEK